MSSKQLEKSADTGTPPHPPPRVSSQTSTASNKVIPLMAAIEKPVRPVWFRVAYVALIFAIVGIIITVIGTVLVVLSFISVRTGEGIAGRGHVYFGRKVPKHSGFYVLAIGISLTFFSYLAYKACLLRIDKYINELQEFNSKHKTDAREAGVPVWTETDALMEEDEDDYYLEKQMQLQKKQKMKK